MKRLLSSLLLVSLLAFPAHAEECDGLIYTDVGENCPEDDYFYWDDIEMLTSEGIFTGNEDGSFAPTTGMNRAEFATLLKRVSGVSPSYWSAYNASCFVDIETDQWFTENVCFAEEQGWFQGYDDGTFGFQSKINRAEAIKTVVEMLSLELPYYASISYDDVPSDSWYAPYVVAAEEAGLLEEMSSYRPGDEMTREEIAYILARAVEYIDENGFDTSQQFHTFYQDEWVHGEDAMYLLEVSYPNFYDEYENYTIVQDASDPDLYYFAAHHYTYEYDGSNTSDFHQHALIFEYDANQLSLLPIWEEHYDEGDFEEFGGDSYAEMLPRFIVRGYHSMGLAVHYQTIDDSPGFCFDPILTGEDYPYYEIRGFFWLGLSTFDMIQEYAPPSDVINKAEAEYVTCLEEWGY